MGLSLIAALAYLLFRRRRAAKSMDDYYNDPKGVSSCSRPDLKSSVSAFIVCMIASKEEAFCCKNDWMYWNLKRQSPSPPPLQTPIAAALVMQDYYSAGKRGSKLNSVDSDVLAPARSSGMHLLVMHYCWLPFSIMASNEGILLEKPKTV